MIVYRIGRTKYSHDLTGEGARLNGGRWNHKLTPCIYTSQSRALALLEYTVNVNIDDIPRVQRRPAYHDIPRVQRRPAYHDKPRVKKALEDEHIILTTWRELMELRQQVK